MLLGNNRFLSPVESSGNISQESLGRYNPITYLSLRSHHLCYNKHKVLNKLKIIYSPLFLSIFIFLFHQLAVFNLFSGLFDEGFLQYNAHLITQGQVPYRDFFLSTTPGTFYVLAFFYKYLGSYIVIERILGIFVVITTLFVCNKLFKLKTFWQYLYLISLALLSVAPARTFYYNDSTILFTLLALYFLIKGIEKDKMYLIVISGLMSGISFLFKQSVGGLLFPAFIIGIFLVSNKNNFLKYILSYVVGGLAILAPVSFYFIFNNAFPQALYYIFLFAGSAKSHQLSFLTHRLIAIPFVILFFILLRRVKLKIKLLLISLAFLAFLFYLILNTERIDRLLAYLPDPIFYVQSLSLLFPLIILSLSLKIQKIENRRLILIAVAYLVLFLSLAASGYNMYPAMVVAPLFIPLLISFSETYGKKLVKHAKVITLATVLVIFGYTITFSQNPLRFRDPVFGSYPESHYIASLDIKEAQYMRFTPSESKDLMRVISYIRNNTKKDEKIFCFPYCPGLLFLSGRDGGSYYSLFYFETFMEKDQNFVINDLQKNNVNLVVLQKTGGIEQRKQLEEQRLSKIRNYITANYSKVLETPNFTILRN